MQLRIPKQTDRQLMIALGKITAQAVIQRNYSIRFTPPSASNSVELPRENPEKYAPMQYIFDEDSRIVSPILLFDQNQGRIACYVSRHHDKAYDTVDFGYDNYFGHLPEQDRPSLYVKLLGLVRRELGVTQYETGFDGLGNSEWTAYLENQRLILDSLQTTSQRVLVDAARNAEATEAALRSKYTKLEESLRAELAAEKEAMLVEHKKLSDEIAARESALKTRSQSFNTKEARYVARQKQDEQIKELKEWLKDWHLTKGTSGKRLRVEVIYVISAMTALGISIYATAESFDLLKSRDLAALPWWQWAALSLKSVVPFAIFTTLVVYYIKWSAAWARQHSEEEFRNRARVIDIGRSGWLLEAVRDAQDNKQTIPPELLTELSRNLFAVNTGADADLHPQSLPEMLSRGMKLKLKATDGSELEASRGK